MTDPHDKPDDGAADGAWQRLSPLAVGLVLLDGVVGVLRQHLPLLLGAGAGLAMLERIGLRELALGAGGLLGLALLLSLLYYRRFRYRLEGDVLVVQKGLFEHREFKVAAGHIQNIVRHQPLYLRPFDVVLWEAETLAGEASRIALPGIPRRRAEALERGLRAAGDTPTAPPRQASGEADAPSPSRTRTAPVFRISWRGVVLHGLASRSVYLVAAMLSPLVRPLERWLHDRLPRLALADGLPSPWVMVPLGILAVLLLLVVLAILAAWWRYHGYVLHDEGDRQVQTSGLFHRQQQALSLPRLQVVEWVQTGLGRLLGRGFLVCHQFGALGGDAAEARRFVVPGLSRAEGEALTARFWAGHWPRQPLRQVDPSYRRVLLLRHLLVLGALGGALLALVGVPTLPATAWAALVVLGLGACTGLAQLRWRATAWAQDDGYLRVRRGVLGRRLSVFPLHHLVALSLQQSWLQRRRGVVTLHLELANGRQSLPYLNEAEARRLADRLLVGVEAGQDACSGRPKRRCSQALMSSDS